MPQKNSQSKKVHLKVWQFDPAQITAYYNYALCDALATAGADVTYFTSPYIYDDVIVPNTFATEYIYFRGLNNGLVKKSSRLRKLLRGASYPLGHLEAIQKAKQAHPDIVHLQWSRLPRFDRPFINSMRAQGAKIVHTVHDIVPLFEQPEAAYAIGEIYSVCDALIVHAEANRRELLDVFPQIDPGRISTIPMISPQRVFPSPTLDRALARRDFLQSVGIDPHKLVFLLLGNLKHYKGLDLLLEAFECVAEQRDDVCLLIAGKSDGDDITSSIGPISKRLGLVTIRVGYVPTSDIWKFHWAADVAIFPYHRIYQSAAIITAMSYGLPVIATNVGALPETVDENGWVVTPTADALAAAMIDAVQQRAMLPAMGSRSLELIQTRHAPEIVGRRLIEIYQQALG